MSEIKLKVSEIVKDGVKIITYSDGSLHFEPVEQPKPIIDVDNRTWWKKIKNWWTNAKVRPYMKIRDLADPFDDRDDPDKGSDGKSAAEIGIQIRF